MKNVSVLILGINGMTGNTVYKYLKKKHNNVFGTTRKSGELILSVENLPKDFKNVIKKIKNVDFVINCIGINKVDEGNTTQAIRVNSYFPNQLSDLAKKYNFKLIHISTDAVFSKTSGRVDESEKPSPEDMYGISKLLGEPLSNNSLTIRTSLIGTNLIKKAGLVEFVLNSSGEINGYNNQIWSGCTTIQFAKFVESLIYNKQISKLQKAKVLHFAPLGPIRKYELIKEIVAINSLKTRVNKTESSVIITRYLSSKIISKKTLELFGRNTFEELNKFINV